MISRLWSGEYGEKFLVLKGLNASQVENISVALERKRLAALVTGSEGWQIIGSLNNYLAHTLNQVMEKRHLTLRQLSEEEGIGMNTSGTRLLNLYKKRLVVRGEGPATRKRRFPSGKAVRLSIPSRIGECHGRIEERTCHPNVGGGHQRSSQGAIRLPSL